jgi:hypothetical protein
MTSHSRCPDCRRRNNNTETCARHAHDGSNARSILRNAAIRKQFNAVHVGTVVGCEKCRNSTHVIWRTQAAERNIGKNAGLLLGSHQDRQARGIDMAGTQNVDSDPMASEIHDPAACERTHCRLRGIVD